jgi:NhaA family Na+:H+ antiporter
MPIFALANAGVAISGDHIVQPVSVAIVAGLVFGKPIGVLTVTWLAVRLRLASLSFGLSWPFMAAGALLTGIGFTMSLFIADLAFAPAMLDVAKIGILTGSAVSAAVGLMILAWLTSRQRIA